MTETLNELAARGITIVGPVAVGENIERNVRAVAQQLGIQVASVWRYFDADGLADSIAEAIRKAQGMAGVAPGWGRRRCPRSTTPSWR